MRYTLKQLEVFLAVAHHQNVSHAAQSLSMSQSAVSEALKTLENQFELQLFDRAGKSLRLNALGKALQQESANLIERAKTLELSFSQHQEDVQLKVGATLSIGNYLAIGLISSFKEMHPNANIEMKVANTTEIAERVLGFELDVGLIEGEINHTELIVDRWLEDELVVFCSPNHPYAKLKSVSDAQLKQAKWVLRETGSGTRQAFDYAMHGLLSQLNVSMELEHTEAIKRAVESDIGIACLSKITLNDAFSRGTLIPINVPQRDFKRYLYLIRHRDKYINNTIKAWLTLCAEQHS